MTAIACGVSSKRQLGSAKGNSLNDRTWMPLCSVAAALHERNRVHAKEYVERVEALSADQSGALCHNIGHHCSFSIGGYQIAALAAGGSIALTDAALDGVITNGYALCRCVTHHWQSQHLYCVDSCHSEEPLYLPIRLLRCRVDSNHQSQYCSTRELPAVFWSSLVTSAWADRLSAYLPPCYPCPRPH